MLVKVQLDIQLSWYNKKFIELTEPLKFLQRARKPQAFPERNDTASQERAGQRYSYQVKINEQWLAILIGARFSTNKKNLLLSSAARITHCL